MIATAIQGTAPPSRPLALATPAHLRVALLTIRYRGEPACAPPGYYVPSPPAADGTAAKEAQQITSLGTAVLWQGMRAEREPG